MSVSLNIMKTYPRLELSSEETVFLQKFLAVLIENRPGSVKATEAQRVGELHNKTASYIQGIIDSEKSKKTNSETKRCPTSFLPPPSLWSVSENKQESK